MKSKSLIWIVAGVLLLAMCVSGVSAIPVQSDFQVITGVTSGYAPVEFRFADLSTNTPTTWDWSFGDGSTNSPVQNPVHMYYEPGSYTVSLHAWNAEGGNTKTYTNLITVTEGPASGHLTVTSNPTGATVYVDGAQQNFVTPHTYYGITGGSRLVQVDANNGRQKNWVTINYQQNTNLYVDLLPSAPTFGSITPNSGPTTGGQTVDIAGANFVEGYGGAPQLSVSIGGSPATLSWTRGDTIVAFTPSNTAGPTTVAITNGGWSGGSVTVPSGTYTYVAPVLPVHNTISGISYATIQEAIDDSATVANDVITVDSGTYDGFTVNDKPLTIRGVNTAGSLPGFSYNGVGNVITIMPLAAGTTIDNFIINNYHNLDSTSQVGVSVGSSGNTITNVAVNGFYYGIRILNGYNNNLIQKCTGSGNLFGVYLNGDSAFNTIDQCTFTNGYAPTPIGIEIEGGSTSSNNNHITGSTISGMKYGIRVGTPLAIATHNRVEGNTVMGNTHGIIVYGNQNDIKGNDIRDNTGEGIWVDTAAHDNLIYNNKFNQATNAYVYAGANVWNVPPTAVTNIINGPQLGGNFWVTPTVTGFSDTCTNNGYGFCTLPYEINGNNIDNYPLTINEAILPTFDSAATDSTGNHIIIYFDQEMAAPPAASFEYFSYSINSGGNRAFSSAALVQGDPHRIDLTVSGPAIAYGDGVTVSYTKGTGFGPVTSSDGVHLASFTPEFVQNFVPAAPTTALHLRKVVVNTNGGTAHETDWTLSAVGPTPLSGTTPVDSDASFSAGTYTLSESGGPLGYTPSAWSCSPVAAIGTQITVPAGQDVTCTITNWNNIPSLTLIKNVVNSGGGTAQAIDWTLSAAGPTPLSGTTPVTSGAGFFAGSYALSESGPAGYTASAWSCIGGTQNINQITVGLGESATCSITNTDIPPTYIITFTAAGDQSYYLGETVQFDIDVAPSNSAEPYMFVIGPNLPAVGAQLDSDPVGLPVINGNEATFTRAPIQSDTPALLKAQYIWTTAENTQLDAGTYTIYASTQPNDIDHIGGSYYATVSIIIKKPFISATFTESNGPVGHIFIIHGTKEGAHDPVYITCTNNTPPTLTGNLPSDGVKPEVFSVTSVTGNPATFGSTTVLPDASFSYSWDTNSISGGSLIPGTRYAFLVMNTPVNINDALGDMYPDNYYTKLAIGIDGVHADYTTDKTSCTAPCLVSFTDTSTAIPDPITEYAIDFDDGYVRIGNSPGSTISHTYTSAGSFTPWFTAMRGADSDHETPITITVNPPSSIITVTSPNGGESWEVGTTHSITWTSSNVPGTSVDISAVYGGSTTVPITYGAELVSGSYLWTIPQGWVEGNQYVIKVTSSSDPAISDVSNGYFEIAAPPPVLLPVADFTADKLNEVAPLNVQFYDRSTGLPDTRSWNFGDGSTSTVKDPFHTYYGAGQSYTVSLTVKNGGGSSTKTMVITVPAATAPAADFKYIISPSNVQIVEFTDTSTGTPIAWSWDFGDGTTPSTIRNPAHPFDLGTDKVRTFWVKLTATYSGSITKSVTKQVAVATITKVVAQDTVEAHFPSTPIVINHVSPVAIPAGSLEFGGGQPSIPVPQPGHLVARLPYHRNGDGETQLYLVTSEGVYQDLGVAQSLPLNAVIEAEDPYGMTEDAYGGANGVVSAETSSTTGGLGPLNLLSKVPLNSQTHNYAILIDGGKNANENHIRYWNDISFMYQTLTKVYGYPKANIKVLMSDGGSGIDRHYATENGVIKTDDSPLDLDGDGSAETVGIASKTNLINTLYNLNTSKTSSDHLFIFTTGHGGQISGNDVKYYLWNGDEITDAEFVNALPDKFGDITMVMEQCNGGGFLDNFQSSFHTGYTTQKRIIHTAASSSESSYGNAFSNVWTRGVAMINDRVQPTAEADTTGSDGKVSMEEAFNFAKNTDPAATGALINQIETPQHQNTNTPGETTKYLFTTGWATPNTIIVAVPNVVETWYAGFDRPIAWTSRGVTNVKIELYNSTPAKTYVIKNTIAGASGKWTWPYNEVNNTGGGNSGTRTYKIKITDTAASGTTDMSDQYFYILRGGVAGPLSITSDLAGAKIYLDGVDTTFTTSAGTTQISSSASPGTHTIALVAPSGYLDQERMITRPSQSGGWTAPAFSLLPIDTNNGYGDDDTGSMTITATPPEAHIYIDGQDQGTTLYRQEVIPGINWKSYPHKYNVEVKLDGYATAQENVEVGRGWNEQKAFRLMVPDSPPILEDIEGTIDPVILGKDAQVSSVVTALEYPITAVWTWGDGSQPEQIIVDNPGKDSHDTILISGTHAYSSTGIYTVSLQVTDTGGRIQTIYAPSYIVVYDPSAGFVTGGGWIDSPAGANPAVPTMTGKATFGFVSKYLKGAKVPTGNTEFQFKAGDLNFKSVSYDWLVVAGPKAQFKGVGTINGQGQYGFILTAVDGALNGGGGTDKFRIKIWNMNNDAIVYDNQIGAADSVTPSTGLGGGSIIIHTGK